MADFLGQDNRRNMFIHSWQISLDRATEGRYSSTDGRYPWAGQQKEDVHSLMADFLGQDNRRKMFINRRKMFINRRKMFIH